MSKYKVLNSIKYVLEEWLVVNGSTSQELQS